MLVEIKDYDGAGNQSFVAGAVTSSDGTEVATWYYYETEDNIEIWFEPDKDFANLLSAKQVKFLEKEIMKEVVCFEKESTEFDQSAVAVTP